MPADNHPQLYKCWLYKVERTDSSFTQIFIHIQNIWSLYCTHMHTHSHTVLPPLQGLPSAPSAIRINYIQDTFSLSPSFVQVACTNVTSCLRVCLCVHTTITSAYHSQGAWGLRCPDPNVIRTMSTRCLIIKLPTQDTRSTATFTLRMCGMHSVCLLTSVWSDLLSFSDMCYDCVHT